MHQPPKHIYNLLAKLCPEYLWEGIAGDLEEQFYSDIEEVGLKKAKRNYFWNAVKFIRPGILLRNSFKPNNNTIMVSNYFKTAARSMARRKLFTFINAFGLSIGIAFCLLIYLFIQDEKSFDSFHTNAKDIYRIDELKYKAWKEDLNPKDRYSHSAYLQTGLGPALKDEIPEVKYMSRYNANWIEVVKYGDKIFNENITFVDNDFFKMFSFKVVEGNAGKFLLQPHEVVLTESIARKYFGDSDPFGKLMSIEIDQDKEYEVVGIVADPPANSSFAFEILTSSVNRSYYERNLDNWRSFNTPTFVQLNENASLNEFQQKLDGIRDKYMAEDLARDKEKYSVPDDITMFEYQTTNLLDVHLNNEVRWYKVSDPQYSFILGALAILIIIIASINYISLALTTSAARSTEVGVRKSIGANPNQLIYQFTFESILLAIISLIVGLLLMVFFLPIFNEFTDKKIVLDAMSWINILSMGFGLALFIGLLAGSYPAFVLSRFKPASVLKGRSSSKLNSGFAKPLVLIQFTLSSVLIISAFVMFRQMEYITTKDLGFNKEQVLVVPTNLPYGDEMDQAVIRMRSTLASNPNISEVSGTSASFNQGWSRHAYEIDGETKVSYSYGVDDKYISTLGIELLMGRNFDPAIPSDTNALIVNEALVKDMGWENPLEEHLNWREDTVGSGFKIIGVVKNYHFLSLESKVEPVLLSINREHVGYLNTMLIKIKSGKVQDAISEIEDAYKKNIPNKPFDFSFLDDDVNQQYASFDRWMNIMGVSTIFALLISGLGLFGLAGINAVNRTKEIGIRKVFGAPIMSLFLSLNKQFVIMAILAFTIAAPMSYYIMNNWWLSDFEFKIEMGIELYATAFFIGLFVAIITVSYHGLKAANLDPAKTLKYE